MQTNRDDVRYDCMIVFAQIAQHLLHRGQYVAAIWLFLVSCATACRATSTSYTLTSCLCCHALRATVCRTLRSCESPRGTATSPAPCLARLPRPAQRGLRIPRRAVAAHRRRLKGRETPRLGAKKGGLCADFGWERAREQTARCVSIQENTKSFLSSNAQTRRQILLKPRKNKSPKSQGALSFAALSPSRMSFITGQTSHALLRDAHTLKLPTPKKDRSSRGTKPQPKALDAIATFGQSRTFLRGKVPANAIARNPSKVK